MSDNNGKIYKCIRGKFILFCSLAVILITLLSGINNSLANSLSSDAESTIELVRTKSYNTVLFRDMEKVRESEGLGTISAYSEILSGVFNRFGVYGGNIKIVLTDSEYNDIYNIEMVKGTFLTSQTVEKGKAYAVISDQMAVKLFKTIDVIGNEIQISEQSFIVAGVYKGKSSIIWDVLSDGRDRIFIPYSSYNNAEEMAIDIISIVIPPGQDVYSLVNILEKNLGCGLESYDITKLSDAFDMSYQFINLFTFIVGLTSILLTVLLAFRLTKKTAASLKNKTELYYPGQLFKTEKRRIIYNAAVILMFCIVAACIIYSIRFKIIIPDRYLPYDNIFDIKLYLDNMISDVHAAAFDAGRVMSILSYSLNLSVKIAVFLAIPITVLFIAAEILFRL
ncbi:MAG: ABC transporter permease, partial [Eubacteriales bacterium]|nr:ABC transporter permease [Eubacteriales bacterium]